MRASANNVAHPTLQLALTRFVMVIGGEGAIGLDIEQEIKGYIKIMI